jgi:hypothetical protein
MPNKCSTLHTMRCPPSLLYRAAICGGVCVLGLVAGFEGAGAFSLVLGALAGVLSLRALTVRVNVRPNALKVANPIRNYVLRWSDIEDIRLEERPMVWFGAGFGAKRLRVLVVRPGKLELSLAATQSINGGIFGRMLKGQDRTVGDLDLLRSSWQSSRDEGE